MPGLDGLNSPERVLPLALDRRDDLRMRVEAGAVVDEFDLPGIGQVVARHTRMRSGDDVTWACMFTVVAASNADLAIVHRLSAPTLAEARRSVRHAVEFLAGRTAAGPPAGPLANPLASRQAGRRAGDLAADANLPPAGRDLPTLAPQPHRGVVPSFVLPAGHVPADHLPAPLP
jgi:hypothetical protein